MLSSVESNENALVVRLFMFIVYLGSFHELLLAPTPDATTPSDPVA